MFELPPELNLVLRSLDPLIGKSWSVSPLAGGITNRNYLLRVEGDEGAEEEAFVLRMAGAGTERLGIDRAREHACAVAAAECGAACDVVARLPEQGALLVRYAPGVALADGALEHEARLARAVTALKRFHEGRAVPGEFHVLRTVRQYAETAATAGAMMAADIALLMARLEQAVIRPAGELLRPCHNDLLPANLIDDGERIRLIDWEYAAMGDAWFDLGNLAENNLLSAQAERRLLQLYCGGAYEDGLLRLRRMRFASAMREAAWGFAQVALSQLDFDFAAYGARHLQRARTLSEKLETP
jgi:thiamine kinase-like enzyme